MKILKLLLGAPLLWALMLSSGTSFTACKKTVIVHDTVYDVSTGLVAYYNFNGGNLNDSSGYGNNISFNNATLTADRFGNPSNAYLFNGINSYMEVPNTLSLNPNNLTLFAIVKMNGFFSGPCTENQILGKGYPDFINGFYDLRFSNTNPCSTFDSTSENFLWRFW